MARHKPHEGVEIIRQNIIIPVMETIQQEVTITDKVETTIPEKYEPVTVYLSEPGDAVVPPDAVLLTIPDAPGIRVHTLAQRVRDAEKRLAESTCIAETCYWQGALDALNAYRQGVQMPDVIGLGVKKKVG